MEVLLLSGGTPNANFRDLAHAWGRDRGFHQLLVNTVCERRGEVDRKRRSDARAFALTTTTTPNKKIKRENDNETKPTAAAAVASKPAAALPVAKNDIDETPIKREAEQV